MWYSTLVVEADNTPELNSLILQHRKFAAGKMEVFLASFIYRCRETNNKWLLGIMHISLSSCYGDLQFNIILHGGPIISACVYYLTWHFSFSFPFPQLLILLWVMKFTQMDWGRRRSEEDGIKQIFNSEKIQTVYYSYCVWVLFLYPQLIRKKKNWLFTPILYSCLLYQILIGRICMGLVLDSLGFFL